MTRTYLTIVVLLLVSAPSVAATKSLTDSEVIEQIKSSDPVLKSIFITCTNEHLVRRTEGTSEFFTYTAKCTLKESLDACEREEVTIYGDFEGNWTPYDTRLHLLCLD